MDAEEKGRRVRAGIYGKRRRVAAMGSMEKIALLESGIGRTSADIAMMLVRDENAHVRRAAAKRIDLPKKAYLLLADDSDPSIRRVLAANPSVPAAAMGVLSRDCNVGVRCCLARVQRLGPVLALRLARDVMGVREEMAGNRALPDKAAAVLEADEDYKVRIALAVNAKTKPEALARLAKDRHFLVRMRIAENPSLPVESAAILAQDSEPRTRLRIAEGGWPPWILAMLAEDPVAEIAAAAKKGLDRFSAHEILDSLAAAAAGRAP